MEQLSAELAIVQTSNQPPSLKDRVQFNIDHYTKLLEDLKKIQENLNKNPEFFEEFYSRLQRINYLI
jgi:hypothetical protein